ncbi:MAG: nitrous oxide reductase accessory protein NosL [Melioribacter sp.]|uniref:nitrous oxide reductase accessory protein NosL n=1 Tax=Melioribacter sp. TaxID=2052167 RepID=UPI003BBF72AD
MKKRKKIKLLSVASLLLIAIGCSKSPQPIKYGAADCDYCNMTVTDPKFGSVMVTDKGKILFFDSIECLAAYELTNNPEAYSLWVSDYTNPGELMPADKAIFLLSDGIKSPMALGLAAFPDRNKSENARKTYNGKIISWEEVKKYVKREWNL